MQPVSWEWVGQYLGTGEGLMSNANDVHGGSLLVQVCHGSCHVCQDADYHLQVQLQGQVVHHLL